MKEVAALVFDVFGTAVDWRTGIAAVASRHGLPGERFADAWRARYAPSMDLVRRRELEWMNLDALHRRSLDELLEEFGAAGLGEPERRGQTPFPLEAAFRKAPSIEFTSGTQREPGLRSFREAVELIVQGAVEIGYLLAPTLGLEQAPEALELARERGRGAVKINLDPTA